MTSRWNKSIKLCFLSFCLFFGGCQILPETQNIFTQDLKKAATSIFGEAPIKVEVNPKMLDEAGNVEAFLTLSDKTMELPLIKNLKLEDNQISVVTRKTGSGEEHCALLLGETIGVNEKLDELFGLNSSFASVVVKNNPGVTGMTDCAPMNEAGVALSLKELPQLESQSLNEKVAWLKKHGGQTIGLIVRLETEEQSNLFYDEIMNHLTDYLNFEQLPKDFILDIDGKEVYAMHGTQYQQWYEGNGAADADWEEFAERDENKNQ